ncbi:MAG TPA: MFS transporter [Bradyrhizobium sp.]|uniref:MFS transporter n=1 Tax=Bradyrhizobium sp. TaxID=376 RepID=UPI002D7FFCFD|nr:MFS transporter [Bradyrhizobium sp.]HET7887201.1 MFS transporter [Bradyrhizobium sp.]
MSQETTSAATRSPLARLPRGIWALGFVSLFMDISSEMIHGLLPVFLTSVLGASTELVGLIEGIGEATASISKLFSGWLSDRLGKRKLLAVAGYGLAALSKPLFALALSPSFVLAARFADRVGKGIRGAPRDAMVGDMVPVGLRGAAYGLRQALDTVGAFAGPLMAVALMAGLHDNFRLIFWLSLIPAMVSVLVLVVAVREPPHEEVAERPALKLSAVKTLGRAYWIVVAVGAVLTLARFSEAFLILRAQGLGLPLALTPLVLVVMNIVYSLSAYPLGALSDRVSRPLLLGVGFAILIVSDIVLAVAPNLWVVAAGVALWGLHMGMTQGLLAALIADEAPANLRATSFGVFNFVSGVALLLASVIAGALWDMTGPYATFLAGAAFSAVGLVGSALVLRR